MAAQDLGDYDVALSSLRTAVRRAERSGATTVAAQARMSLAYVLMERGATADALENADRAALALRGPARAQILTQRALILQRCGRTGEALTAYRQTLPVLRRTADWAGESRLRTNRGLLYLQRGELGAAEADFNRAIDLEHRIGNEVHASYPEWNLGYVSARRGDVPLALQRWDRAEATMLRHGVQARELLLPRAELLLSVGLREEARATAERAVSELRRADLASHLAQALLLLAQVALAQGDDGAGTEAAARAVRMFVRQRRPGWAAAARYVSLRAEEKSGQLTPALRRRALRVADELAAIGWRTQELDARLVAAQVSLSRGNLDTARRELRQNAAARSSGPVELRIRAWYAEALLRLATGRRPAAETALRAGFRVIERQRATLGATELRVQVAGHAADLADLGLRLAERSGSPAKVLEWAERWRARSLDLRPVRPPEDPALAAALAELRRITAEAESSLLEGRSAGSLPARKASLEERVRRLARRTRAPLFAPQLDPPSVDEIAAGLGDRVLVELIGPSGGPLLAVTVADGVARLHDLGPAAPLRRTLDGVLFALRRLAMGHGSPASLAAATTSLLAGAGRLDAALLGPLRAAVDGRPLVIVPPGPLRSMPWSLLPGCAGVPVTVAPSAAVWLRSAGLPAPRPDGSGRVVLVCGPRLDGAAAEIERLAAGYPAATRLDGAAATVDRTLSALDGADVAHLATHGTLRGDNPLFSALELADGPLTVYDLERLAGAPRLVMLPACQSGVGSELAGDEVLGLTSALFALGTRTAVATVVPVPDEATCPLMVAVHERLRRGLPVASALADAQAEVDRDDPAQLATAGGFVCFGAG